MIRIHLDPEQRAAIHALRRDPTLRPAERDRVEMVLLSAEGRLGERRERVWPLGAAGRRPDG